MPFGSSEALLEGHGLPIVAFYWRPRLPDHRLRKFNLICEALFNRLKEAAAELNERPQINGNVLIEIGAAMALYPGNKFILLVEEGLRLPSNLQGLYECRYKGDELNTEATMKLLRAFNDFKAAA